MYFGCTTCEHCQAPVYKSEDITFRDRYSYHKKCHKCYVCSETNLRDAELFKGVIFCSSCSQRIFQGCSSARKTKDTPKKPQGNPRRRSHRTEDKHSTKRQNGILEMVGLAGANSAISSVSDSDGDEELRPSKSIALPTEIALTPTKRLAVEIPKKRSSVSKELEIGLITEVTQELLKQMQCPVNEKKLTNRVKPRNVPKKKKPCSDLRIAELGTSTEIANMALRHRSELPVIIKSESRTKHTSQSGSLNRESDRNDDWIDSAYSTLRGSAISYWMNRRFGSILALPYKSFKKHILNRSSVISVLTSSSENKVPLLQRIKILFRYEINEHQKRGLKRLYSTINRQNPRHKLGWLNCDTYHKRCKHLRESHSYRCMRAQVMRLAGPTKSELADFRAKVKNAVTPRVRHIPKKRIAAIMMSQASGNSGRGSTKVM